jgi:hypothetical protein
VKLAIHLHLMPTSKNKWSYNSTPPIRRGVRDGQLKHRDDDDNNNKNNLRVMDIRTSKRRNT